MKISLIKKFMKRINPGKTAYVDDEIKEEVGERENKLGITISAAVYMEHKVDYYKKVITILALLNFFIHYFLINQK